MEPTRKIKPDHPRQRRLHRMQLRGGRVGRETLNYSLDERRERGEIADRAHVHTSNTSVIEMRARTGHTRFSISNKIAHRTGRLLGRYPGSV